MNQVCVEYEDIKKFLNISEQPEESIQQFLNYTLEYLHWICHYEEEDRLINFDLAIGINIDTSFIKGRTYPLVSSKYEDSNLSTISDCIKFALKKSIAICSGYSNVYMYIDTTTNNIVAGIYSSDLGKEDLTIKSMLDNEMILFHHVNDNSVLIRKREDDMLVHFSIVLDELPVPNYTSHKSTTMLWWNDMFSRIERSVHGTICLIVSPEWSAKEDDNFQEGKIIELEQRINVFPPFESSAENIIEFNNSFNIFLSMLNYDGITVIDTNGSILAYNGICKSNSKAKQTGGARHHAFDQLSQSSNSSYRAIYMLSQEGEIDFFSFETKEKTHRFNSAIMSGSKQYYIDIKQVKKKTLESKKNKDDLRDVFYYARDLRDAHNSFDNFYKEPKAAKELLEAINSIPDKSINFWRNNLLFLRKILNSLIVCYIGNAYGHSFGAIAEINQAFEYFDDCWELYVEEKMYYDSDILWAIANFTMPYKRWINLIHHYDVPKLSDYTMEDYNEMLQGFRLVEQDENEDT